MTDMTEIAEFIDDDDGVAYWFRTVFDFRCMTTLQRWRLAASLQAIFSRQPEVAAVCFLLASEVLFQAKLYRLQQLLGSIKQTDKASGEQGLNKAILATLRKVFTKHEVEEFELCCRHRALAVTEQKLRLDVSAEDWLYDCMGAEVLELFFVDFSILEWISHKHSTQKQRESTDADCQHTRCLRPTKYLTYIIICQMVILALVTPPKFPSVVLLCQKILDESFKWLVLLIVKLMNMASDRVHSADVRGLGRPLLRLYDAYRIPGKGCVGEAELIQRYWQVLVPINMTFMQIALSHKPGPVRLDGAHLVHFFSTVFHARAQITVGRQKSLVMYLVDAGAAPFSYLLAHQPDAAWNMGLPTLVAQLFSWETIRSIEGSSNTAEAWREMLHEYRGLDFPNAHDFDVISETATLGMKTRMIESFYYQSGLWGLGKFFGRLTEAFAKEPEHGDLRRTILVVVEALDSIYRGTDLLFDPCVFGLGEFHAVFANSFQLLQHEMQKEWPNYTTELLSQRLASKRHTNHGLPIGKAMLANSLSDPALESLNFLVTIVRFLATLGKHLANHWSVIVGVEASCWPISSDNLAMSNLEMLKLVCTILSPYDAHRLSLKVVEEDFRVIFESMLCLGPQVIKCSFPDLQKLFVAADRLQSSRSIHIESSIMASFDVCLQDWLSDESSDLSNVACPRVGLLRSRTGSFATPKLHMWYFNCLIFSLSRVKGLSDSQIAALREGMACWNEMLLLVLGDLRRAREHRSWESPTEKRANLIMSNTFFALAQKYVLSDFSQADEGLLPQVLLLAYCERYADDAIGRLENPGLLMPLIVHLCNTSWSPEAGPSVHRAVCHYVDCQNKIIKYCSLKLEIEDESKATLEDSNIEKALGLVSHVLDIAKHCNEIGLELSSEGGSLLEGGIHAVNLVARYWVLRTMACTWYLREAADGKRRIPKHEIDDNRRLSMFAENDAKAAAILCHWKQPLRMDTEELEKAVRAMESVGPKATTDDKSRKNWPEYQIAKKDLDRRKKQRIPSSKASTPQGTSELEAARLAAEQAAIDLLNEELEEHSQQKQQNQQQPSKIKKKKKR